MSLRVLSHRVVHPHLEKGEIAGSLLYFPMAGLHTPVNALAFFNEVGFAASNAKIAKRNELAVITSHICTCGLCQAHSLCSCALVQ